ncbi:hypothetical protein [Rhizobium sp. NLR22b]|uniref:hypothetical protein n=1 Tax=Rhizobium sp. NLR22b TaxID=2731115 RepID=UPI001C83BA6B|nr:hypothetical protein [Rhizobium sp. NLR22b]MBX5238668.1 hypothetical protein [Rhizobium sp. NLR22b]
MLRSVRFASVFWIAVLAAAPIAAEECQADKSAVDARFNEALEAIIAHQGFAWACAPYTGAGLAQSSTVNIEMLLRDSGLRAADATVKAGELDAKAKKDAELHPISSPGAKREEVIVACSQMMDEQLQKFRLARADMIKAQCLDE